jgi:hypothetical protein
MITIGIDAHKHLYVATVLDAAGREIDRWEGPNSPDGWAALPAWGRSHGRRTPRRCGIKGAATEARLRPGLRADILHGLGCVANGLSTFRQNRAIAPEAEPSSSRAASPVPCPRPYGHFPSCVQPAVAACSQWLSWLADRRIARDTWSNRSRPRFLIVDID